MPYVYMIVKAKRQEYDLPLVEKGQSVREEKASQDNIVQAFEQ